MYTPQLLQWQYQLLSSDDSSAFIPDVPAASAMSTSTDSSHNVCITWLLNGCHCLQHTSTVNNAYTSSSAENSLFTCFSLCINPQLFNYSVLAIKQTIQQLKGAQTWNQFFKYIREKHALLFIFLHLQVLPIPRHFNEVTVFASVISSWMDYETVGPGAQTGKSPPTSPKPIFTLCLDCVHLLTYKLMLCFFLLWASTVVLCGMCELRCSCLTSVHCFASL